MKFGMVIVGDEILSGKRRDTHLAFVSDALKQRGLELSWARIVGDEHDLLVQTYRETRASGAVVFSFGGIGGTPDDITRQCAAEAFGLKIEPHPEAVAILREKFGDDLYPHKVRMAEFPVGSDLIPNPVNRVAGFSINKHYFVPGFPNMSHPMIEWVLDTCYTAEFRQPEIEQRLMAHAPESHLITIEERILEDFPDIRLSSLPNTKDRMQVDLGLRGAPDTVRQAMESLRKMLDAAGIRHEPVADRSNAD
jgi:molybdopterin-biosynthesis enzyme MoeA-like protein